MTDEKKVPESYRIYEEGKQRRYNLLFAVNGGAFALAKFMADKDAPTAALGDLKLSYLCCGMAVFTIFMSLDIFIFGEKMRKMYLPDVFRLPGKFLLFLIGVLICAGWVLVAGCQLMIVVVVILSLICAAWVLDRARGL